jgi:hypothetical protein
MVMKLSKLVISMAMAIPMFPALDAAPVVACTKAMPCNAQPRPINGANQLSPYAPGYNNAPRNNGPSFFANPAQYGTDRIRNGVIQYGIDTNINKVLSDPKTPKGTVSPNIYNSNGVTPSAPPPPGPAYSPYMDPSLYPITPAATLTPND